jgi:hypothetical protein
MRPLRRQRWKSIMIRCLQTCSNINRMWRSAAITAANAALLAGPCLYVHLRNCGGLNVGQCASPFNMSCMASWRTTNIFIWALLDVYIASTRNFHFTTVHMR